MEKICQACGEIFESRKPNQKYCSPRCGRKARNFQAGLSPKVEKICVICGKEFKTQSYNIKTCSPECSLILRREQSRLALQNISKDKVIEVPDEKIFVRVKSIFEILDDYNFDTLRKAVNYLSAYSSVDTAECVALLRERQNKIGHYKIFYD